MPDTDPPDIARPGIAPPARILAVRPRNARRLA